MVERLLLPIPSLAGRTGIGLLLREFSWAFSPCRNLSDLDRPDDLALGPGLRE